MEGPGTDADEGLVGADPDRLLDGVVLIGLADPGLRAGLLAIVDRVLAAPDAQLAGVVTDPAGLGTRASEEPLDVLLIDPLMMAATGGLLRQLGHEQPDLTVAVLLADGRLSRLHADVLG